jgi:hypothetical protein
VELQGEFLFLKAATLHRLVKEVIDYEDVVCVILVCNLCRLVSTMYLFVVTSCKHSINETINVYPVFSH